MEGRRAALHPLLTRSHHLTNLANKYAGDTPQSERDTRTFRRDHLWNPGFVTVTSYTPGRSPPRPATASERLSPAFTVVDAAKPPSRSSIVAPNASGRPDNESRISTTTAFMLGTLGQMRLDEHAAIDARMRAHAVAAVSDWAQRCRRVDVVCRGSGGRTAFVAPRCLRIAKAMVCRSLRKDRECRNTVRSRWSVVGGRFSARNTSTSRDKGVRLATSMAKNRRGTSQGQSDALTFSETPKSRSTPLIGLHTARPGFGGV